MCNTCGCNPCSIVQVRRGPQGDDGPAGTDGQNAQTLFGDGAPTTTLPSGPTPPAAYAIYANTATDGTWWMWNGSAWTDTLAPVSGGPGADGANAWTLTEGTTPVIGVDGSVITVNVADTSWMGLGQMLHITSAAGVDLGYYEVFTIVSATQVFIRNPRDAGTGEYINNANGSTITIGSKVTAGGIQGPQGEQGDQGPQGDQGDPGADGAAGTNGHTPVITYVTSNPTAPGGASGDIRLYQPVSNNGTVTFYFNTSGTWNAGPTVTASRLIGTSTTTAPPPASPVPNTNDYYITYIGTEFTFWVYSSGWNAAFTFDTAGGGGGVGTFQQVSDASALLAAGRRTGNRIWTMERSIQYYPLTVNITSLLTTTLDTQYQWQKISIDTGITSFALNWSAISSNVNCEWIFEFTNNSGGITNIDYVAGRWTKSDGVTHPVTLLAGEVVTLHCYSHKGYMNIAFVEQGTTVI